MIPKIRLTVEQQNDLEQQSQIINRKFIELIRSRQQISQNQKKSFTEDQIDNFFKRFQQLCSFEKMDYLQFRKGLGLLGRQQSFLSRIFYILDRDGDGQLTFEDYLYYLDTILNGSQLQQARFSWILLTQGKYQIQFEDLVNIFQEISVVWNALTGQIITPKKKYIEQLFNIFDIDQDQLITFQDFQVYFEQHPNLFGWFQYLNNVEMDDSKIKQELGDIRKKLREKLNLDHHLDEDLSLEEIGYRVKQVESNIQRKLFNLTDKIKSTVQRQQQKHQKMYSYSKKTTLQQQSQSIPVVSQHHLQAINPQSSFDKNSKNGKNNKSNYNWKNEFSLQKSFITIQQQYQNKSQNNKSNINHKTINKSSNLQQSQQSSVLSIKSLFKYNHQSNQFDNQMSKMKNRREKQQKQTKITSGIQMIKDIQQMLENINKLMQNCNQYRGFKQKQKKFSPTKLKQLQVKYNIVDKEMNNNSNNKQEKRKMKVYFGHQNWNVVLNIMVGLRKSIKSLYDLSSHLKLKDQHFNQMHQFVLGNKTMPGKDSEVYKFIQKAPLIFQRLRAMYGLTNQQYQRSVGPQSLLNQLFLGNLQALNQKCSTGKSGAFFYLTLDNKVFLKTITKHQYVFFQKILKNYYQHMRNYKNSLIVRVYGMYKLKIFINKQKINTIYFISMQNIFANVNGGQNKLKIDQMYDLKGSLYGRTGEEDSQLKDNNWIINKKQIKLPLSIRQVFIDQIILDSKFFKKNNINDYSMMIAMIKLTSQSKLIQKQTQNVFKRFNGGVKSSQPNLLYIMSIIDFLTSFQTLKNMEYLIKTTFLSKDVSCVPPAQYSKRFRDFILNSVSKSSAN